MQDFMNVAFDGTLTLTYLHVGGVREMVSTIWQAVDKRY